MDKKKAGWKAKLFLFAASSSVVALFLVAGEVYCRYFTRINFLDNSSGFITPQRYGASYGNTPNFDGISFGQAFHTDENGFRVDPESRSETYADPNAILILGDSVAFAPGVPDDRSLAGILARELPATRLYNGAVIGFNAADYLNIGSVITNEKPEIKTVLLFFCLNDVSDSSAQLLRKDSEAGTTLDAQPGFSFLRVVNDYLRSRSKLYLFLKNSLVDTQMKYFKSDLAQYQRGEESVRNAILPIVELNKGLIAKGIDMKVFIVPYEVQLRPNADPEVFLPQTMLTSIFQSSGIEFTDTTADFRASGSDPNLLFLYGDPMHLSPEGMKVLAGSVCRTINGCEATRPGPNN